MAQIQSVSKFGGNIGTTRTALFAVAGVALVVVGAVLVNGAPKASQMAVPAAVVGNSVAQFSPNTAAVNAYISAHESMERSSIAQLSPNSVAVNAYIAAHEALEKSAIAQFSPNTVAVNAYIAAHEMMQKSAVARPSPNTVAVNAYLAAHGVITSTP